MECLHIYLTKVTNTCKLHDRLILRIGNLEFLKKYLACKSTTVSALNIKV